MPRKVKVGIIGTGNIGTDLLIKVQRSKVLECGIFAGKNPQSEGIRQAQRLGVPTSTESIDAIVNHPEACAIVFDATSAEAHVRHAATLQRLGKFTIDMTPSRVGKMCIPLMNLAECLEQPNVNMITCGGQATVPIVAAIKRVHPEVAYAEIVSSIASRSAGIGTRDNIDEYTQTTSEGIRAFTDIPQTKAIIILNPAEPPMLMHNTVYALIAQPNMEAITAEVNAVVARIQQYVPGYRLSLAPVFENNRVTTMTEVVGRGDFLPVYAGNLDIINCAAVAVAEAYAREKLLPSEL